MRESGSRWHQALIVAMTTAVFSGVVNNGFLAYDDMDYITDNPLVLGGLTGRGVVEALTTFQVINWSPLTTVSHMVDVSLFGLEPGLHHLMSVAFHSLSCVVLYTLLCALFARPPAALIGTLLFAVHPLRVESVAWASERKDVLCTLFFLLAMRAYIRSAGGQHWRGLIVYAFGALALLAKPMAVTLPAVLLLLDVWPLRRWSRRALPGLILEKLPLIASAGAVSVLTLVAQQTAVETHQALGIGSRAANAVVALATYLGQACWPRDLAVLVPLPPEGFGGVRVLTAASVCVVVSVAVGVLRRPASIVGLAIFFVTLLPVIGLVQVGEQAHADRYTYIPSIGLAIIATDLAAAVLDGRWPRWKVPAFALASALILRNGFETVEQVRVWRSQRTLFAHTVAVTAANPTARALHADALLAEEAPELALAEAREAVRLRPTPDHHDLLGRTLLATGRVDEAIALFTPACALAHPPSCVHLAEALLARGDHTSALATLTAARRLTHVSTELDVLEARIRLAMGEPATALDVMQRVLGRLGDRADATVLELLASTLIINGRVDEAREVIAIAVPVAIAENRQRTLERLRRLETGSR